MPQNAGINAVPLGYSKITTVVPHDTNPSVPAGTKALYIQGTGDLRVMMPNAATPFLFSGLPAGTVLPITPKQILATGTTATNITAMG